MRRLGRLGFQSSVLIYGGPALADVSQAVAEASLELALAAGINHIDLAPSDGGAERRVGAMMAQTRRQVFIASKRRERERDGVAREIEGSLTRLHCEHLDLIQFHAVGDLEALDRSMALGGALEAAIAARDQGLVQGIGIAGHGHAAPAIQLEALRRFPFDTVMTPYNPTLYSAPAFRHDFDALVSEVRRQGVGLIAMKASARRPWREGEARNFGAWYAPLDQQTEIDAAIGFSLARAEVVGATTAGDGALLTLYLKAEANTDLSAEDVERLLLAAGDYDSPYAAGVP